MKASIKEKLIKNDSFKMLVLSALALHTKNELDRLTVLVDGAGTPIEANGPKHAADEKLLTWLRDKMRVGSFQNHSKEYEAKQLYVTGLLSMFNPSDDEDTLDYTQTEQGSILLDWDLSEPKLTAKIVENNYFYGLAGCVAEDFTKTELVNGVWQVPAS